jgi:hypothetical protein
MVATKRMPPVRTSVNTPIGERQMALSGDRGQEPKAEELGTGGEFAVIEESVSPTDGSNLCLLRV